MRWAQRSAGLLLQAAFVCLCCFVTSLGGQQDVRAGARRLWELPDPLSNAVSKEPLTAYRQGLASEADTLVAYRQDMVTRLSGDRFVPFTLADQRAVVQAFREVMVPTQGPVEVISYKEAFPDTAAPERMRLPSPYTELWFSAYWVLNSTQIENLSLNSTWVNAGAQATNIYARWGKRAAEIGGWSPEVSNLTIVSLDIFPSKLQGGFVLHPVLVMNVTLAMNTTQTNSSNTSSSSSSRNETLAEQISAVATAVTLLVEDAGIGTLVEVVGSDSVAAAAFKLRGRRRLAQQEAAVAAAALLPATAGRQLVQLEVTMFACRENATQSSPGCEEALLEAVLQQGLQQQDVAAQLEAAGVTGVEVVSIAQRTPPSGPIIRGSNSSSSSGPQPWQPWHLDRIDQRALPMDGRFNATATAVGVHVYLLSSGVRGDHEEFLKADGSGTRVRPAWGFLGQDPLQDCDDYFVWYGIGTFAASLCCGRTLGAAKNATVHSVRFRQRCLSDSGIWMPGALPSAMDLVLSTHSKPAVVLLDTWLSADRPDVTNLQTIESSLKERLDKMAAANITVVASAGPGLPYSDPCNNIIASHPAVISVASSDTRDQHTAGGAWNSSCIDVWAPSGGLTTGLVGASPAGPANYTQIITHGLGAAAVAAGVAAQYLQLHPNAGPAEVRSVLKAGTIGAITSAGADTTTALLYSEYKEPASAAQQGGDAAGGGGSGSGGEDGSGGGGGISTAAVAAIASVGAVVLVAAAIAVAVIRRRRKRATTLPPLHHRLDGSAEWKIDYDDIEICRRPDGSEWLLGEGHYGKVYKALKGGVQVVAVKKLSHINERVQDAFVKEAEMMKYVSRDANIVQFYGACVKGDNMMLVSEFMEGGDLRNALSAEISGAARSADLQWYHCGKEIMLDVVRGVHFLHASHVIHRDIKSKNILLGRDGRAKLADVGLARLLDGQAYFQDSFAGTLAWAGPELLLGEKCSEKVDCYSLGVVLWEIVTGEMPQRGRLREPDVPRECPQEVADAITACMQRDPEQRPSARELYNMLLACPPLEGPEPLLLKAGSDGSSGGGQNSGQQLWQPRQQPAERQSQELQQQSGESQQLVEPARQGSGASSGPEVNGNTSVCTPPLACESIPSLHSSGELVELRAGGSSSTFVSADTTWRLCAIDAAKIEFVTDPATGAEVKLGAGSFGAVYKVVLDGVQPLAAKVIELKHDAVAESAFMHEAGTLWRLRHRNIVGLSGYSMMDGRGLLLMELMEGGSLFKLLGARSKTSKQRVFGWYQRGKHVALDVACGIHYLHSLKLIHFDIKSANVLLTRELTAKLADVGLARAMSCTHCSLGEDHTMGTFAYMSPELMTGLQCTSAVDIYSFGILLWEICSGNPPSRGQLYSLRVPEDWPQEIADLFQACIATDPADRPTARQVVEQLRKAAS